MHAFQGILIFAAGCALAVPLTGGAESQNQTGGQRGAAASAVAHVDFKIVIPAVLSLDTSAPRGTGARRFLSRRSTCLLEGGGTAAHLVCTAAEP